MDAVTNYTQIYDVDIEIVLNKTWVVLGPEAMNAGASSDHMKYCLHWGIPPYLYMLMQTMGHVDCCLNAVPSLNVFEIHISSDILVTIFICIK